MACTTTRAIVPSNPAPSAPTSRRVPARTKKMTEKANEFFSKRPSTFAAAASNASTRTKRPPGGEGMYRAFKPASRGGKRTTTDDDSEGAFSSQSSTTSSASSSSFTDTSDRGDASDNGNRRRKGPSLKAQPRLVVPEPSTVCAPNSVKMRRLAAAPASGSSTSFSTKMLHAKRAVPRCLEVLTPETLDKLYTNKLTSPSSKPATSSSSLPGRLGRRKYTFVMTQQYASCAVLKAHGDDGQRRFAALERMKFDEKMLAQIRRLPAGKSEFDERCHAPQNEVKRWEQPGFDPDVPPYPLDHFGPKPRQLAPSEGTSRCWGRLCCRLGCVCDSLLYERPSSPVGESSSSALRDAIGSLVFDPAFALVDGNHKPAKTCVTRLSLLRSPSRQPAPRDSQQLLQQPVIAPEEDKPPPAPSQRIKRRSSSSNGSGKRIRTRKRPAYFDDFVDATKVKGSFDSLKDPASKPAKEKKVLRKPAARVAVTNPVPLPTPTPTPIPPPPAVQPQLSSPVKPKTPKKRPAVVLVPSSPEKKNAASPKKVPPITVVASDARNSPNSAETKQRAKPKPAVPVEASPQKLLPSPAKVKKRDVTLVSSPLRRKTSTDVVVCENDSREESSEYGSEQGKGDNYDDDDDVQIIEPEKPCASPIKPKPKNAKACLQFKDDPSIGAPNGYRKAVEPSKLVTALLAGTGTSVMKTYFPRKMIQEKLESSSDVKVSPVKVNFNETSTVTKKPVAAAAVKPEPKEVDVFRLGRETGVVISKVGETRRPAPSPPSSPPALHHLPASPCPSPSSSSIGTASAGSSPTKSPRRNPMPGLIPISHSMKDVGRQLLAQSLALTSKNPGAKLKSTTINGGAGVTGSAGVPWMPIGSSKVLDPSKDLKAILKSGKDAPKRGGGTGHNPLSSSSSPLSGFRFQNSSSVADGRHPLTHGFHIPGTGTVITPSGGGVMGVDATVRSDPAEYHSHTFDLWYRELTS